MENAHGRRSKTRGFREFCRIREQNGAFCAEKLRKRRAGRKIRKIQRKVKNATPNRPKRRSQQSETAAPKEKRPRKTGSAHKKTRSGWGARRFLLDFLCKTVCFA